MPAVWGMKPSDMARLNPQVRAQLDQRRIAQFIQKMHPRLGMKARCVLVPTWRGRRQMERAVRELTRLGCVRFASLESANALQQVVIA